MTDALKDCPYCGESIKAVAIRCKHCHMDLNAPVAVSTPISPNLAASIALSEAEVFDLLTRLVEKSLVAFDAQTGRYQLPETIQSYADDKLDSTQTTEPKAEGRASWRSRHLIFVVEMAEKARTHFSGPEQGLWLARLERDHDNLNAALEWGAKAERRKGLRLAGVLRQFWQRRGHLREGREWLTRMLALPEAAARTPERAVALGGLGMLAWSQGDYAAAEQAHQESLAIYRELGSLSGESEALNSLGLIAWNRGEYAAARAHYEESLAIDRRLGDLQGIAVSLSNLANLAGDQQDYARAVQLHEEALVLERRLDNPRGIAITLNGLGTVYIEQQKYDQARACFEESRAIKETLGDTLGVATAVHNLGGIARLKGNYVAAREMYAASLQARREAGEQLGICQSLEEFAALAFDQEHFVQATRLFGCAHGRRERMGAPKPEDERAELERTLFRLREALTEPIFEAEWNLGLTLTLEQAVSYACQESASW